MVDRTCSVDGCERPIRTRGMCSMHYQRFTRLGSAELPVRDDTCCIDGCDGRKHGRGMCQKHYLRRKHHGSTDDQLLLRRAQLQAAVCSVPQCNRTPKSLAVGLCTKHYQRMRANGTTDARRRPSVKDRFLAKVQKTETCWLWTAGRDAHGYGQMGIGRKVFYAHRLAYELLVGEISPGYLIDHICHNIICVNPDHLRLATNKQNQEHLKGARGNSKTGVRGVWEHRPGRWAAEVGHNGRNHYVGVFDSIEKADVAVTAKRIELFTHNDLDRKATAGTDPEEAECSRSKA